MFDLIRGLFPKHKSTLNLEGEIENATALFCNGGGDQALDILDAVLVQQPKYVPALHLRGAVLASQSKVGEALDVFRLAIKYAPNSAGLRTDYGNGLVIASLKNEAELQYRAALEIDSDYLPALTALGHCMSDQGNPVEAEALFAKACVLSDYDDVCVKRYAVAAYEAQNYRMAVKLLRPYYQKNELDDLQLYIYGTSLVNLGDPEDCGLRELLLVLELAPGSSAARYTLAFHHLYRGEWSEGFRLFEYRQHSAREIQEWLVLIGKQTSRLLPWSGKSLDGKRLLVWQEQGLGDMLMMLRYLPMLVAQCRIEKLVFYCPRSLLRFNQVIDGVEFKQVQSGWVADPADFDFHCSILSLPHLTQIFPGAEAFRAPYIFIPSGDVDAWTTRFLPEPKLRVGIVWAGGLVFALDHKRSLPLSDFEPLFALSEVSFFSLQKDGEARDELLGSGYPVVDWMDQCEDMYDTAAFIGALDLVISVDTSVAHLAGAMGKPVWLLNRSTSEWRWMRGRHDSLWYDQMRIFTQKQDGDWSTVIDEIRTALLEIKAGQR